MTRHGIDQDALIGHISQVTARVGDALRKAVRAATLKRCRPSRPALSSRTACSAE